MINIDFNIEDKNWLKYDPNIKENITEFLQKIAVKSNLKQILEQNINIEISILLTNNKNIRKLNNNYRNKDKATNILSFPLYNLKLSEENYDIAEFLLDNNLILGDLILSLEYLEQEAKTQNKNIDQHLKHLVLHGLLHLIGYDHINDLDAKIMEELEINILSDFNIDNPYILN